MIIGLNGRMRSGKDTVAEIIAELHPTVQRIAFADKLKDSICALFGINREMLELLKLGDNKLVLDPDPTLGDDDYDYLMDEFPQLTFRQFTQRFGTEAHREIFADTFWIDQVFSGLDHEGRIVVITDMRFPNELAAVSAHAGWLVKVKRDEAEIKTDNHASEQHIEDSRFHYLIENNGSLETLRESVGDMLSWMNEIESVPC